MKTAILPTAALLLALFFAVPATHASNAAITYNGFYCSADGQSYGIAITNITSYEQNHGGKVMLTCQFANGSFSNASPAARFTFANTGLYCTASLTTFFSTTSWWLQVNSTGGAVLQCKF